MSEEDSSTERDDGGRSEWPISRRAVLGLSAAAAASSLGLSAVGSEPSGATPVDVPTVYSYGGAPVVQGGTTELLGVRTGTVDESEPNDDRSDATRLPAGATVSATLAASEVDWYTFEAAAGERMAVVLDREHSAGATALLVYDTDGANLDLTFVGGDAPAEIVETAPSDGLYFAQVVDIQDGSGEYTLSVTVGEESTSTPTETPTSTETPTPTPTETPTSTETPAPVEGQSPYGGTVRTIPGRIQAEDFDVSEGDPTYYDTTDGMETSTADDPFYRDVSVDLEASDDPTDDVSVGYVAAGEWLEYTVDVEPGTYEVHLRIASARSSGSVRVTLGDRTLVETDLPVTGSWFAWETVTAGEVTFESGTRDVLRLDVLQQGLNLNWFEFSRVESTTETPTADPTTPTPTPGSDRDFGEQRYGMYGYGGVRQ